MTSNENQTGGTENDEIGRLIKDHYDSQSIPGGQLEDMLREGRRIRALHRWRLASAGLVTLAAIALLAFGVLALRSGAGMGPLAEQVARSHLAHVPSEFDIPTQDFARLDQQMTKLDFTLQPVEARLRERFDIHGARYCKIGEQIACALTVQDKFKQQSGTLFLCRATEPLRGLGSGDTRAEGLSVSYWGEDGVFCSFVAESENP